ncbi:MAG: hypothetical protein Q9N02_08340 [Ghiorsea sp.]|nr:hypothetical protein [Ghiorsea sp.]
MKIISYKKYTDKVISRTLELPLDKNGQPVGTELATVAGITYVSIPASAVLPTQPSEIKASVKTVVLTASEVASIKRVSPHVGLINNRVVDKIRVEYSAEDELKFARLSIAALDPAITVSAADKQASVAYQAAVEAARAWGKVEKAKMGL